MTYILIIANILMIGGFVLKLDHLPPQIPLFYSKQWGEDQLVDLWFIFLLPIFLNTFYFLNYFFFKKFFVTNLLINKIVMYLNLALIILFSVIFLRIIFLVS